MRRATWLLTNLANLVRPLIRYDIGDRVTQHAQPCECGSARPVSILPLALSTVLEEDAALFDLQLVQRGATGLLLRTGLRGATGARALHQSRRVLGAFLLSQGALGVHIECLGGEAIHCNRSGKFQRVVVAPH